MNRATSTSWHTVTVGVALLLRRKSVTAIPPVNSDSKRLTACEGGIHYGSHGQWIVEEHPVNALDVPVEPHCRPRHLPDEGLNPVVARVLHCFTGEDDLLCDIQRDQR